MISAQRRRGEPDRPVGAAHQPGLGGRDARAPPPRAGRRARAGGRSGGAAGRRATGWRGPPRAGRGTGRAAPARCSSGSGVGAPSTDGCSPIAPQSARASDGMPPDSTYTRWATSAVSPCSQSRSIISAAGSGGTSRWCSPETSTSSLLSPGPMVATRATRPCSRRRAYPTIADDSPSSHWTSSRSISTGRVSDQLASSEWNPAARSDRSSSVASMPTSPAATGPRTGSGSRSTQLGRALGEQVAQRRERQRVLLVRAARRAARRRRGSAGAAPR